jgi:GTP-binding protein HflX
VRAVLDEVGVGSTPELLVFNQGDRLPEGVARAIALRQGGVAVSAVTRQGLAELVRRAEEKLPQAPRWDGGAAEALAAGEGGLTA